MSRFTNVVLCLLPPVLTACSGSGSGSSESPDPSPPEETTVTDTAYAALTAGDADQVTALIGVVDAAVAENPDDGRAVFYSGLMRLWQLGDELQVPTEPGELLDTAMTMIDRLAEARDLLPRDDRAPGFLGLAQVEVAKVLGDETMRAEGLSNLDEGIAIFPPYTHFLRALVSVDSPADGDDFASVLGHFQAVTDACGYTKDPSGAFEYPEGALPSSIRVCNDEGIVPHVFEGFFVEYGDALLKAGKPVDEARAAYRSATNAPRFASWPYAAELQDRIDGADARAALYADDDPMNDPTLWNQEGHLCIGCHQDRP